MLQTIDWFLKRVAVVWLILTTAVIAAVLHSIGQSGGLH
jgi:hypothetical protein